MSDVSIPEGLWADDQQGVLATWYYRDGEQVEAGQIIAEILTEKVAHDVEAPVSGRITLLVEEEAALAAGQVIARIAG